MGAIMGRTLVQLFCAASSAAAMTLGYPKFPQNNMTLRLQWAGGTSPYTAQVLTPDLTEWYYQYIGSENSISWDFSLNAGTNIVFQCVDGIGEVAASPVVTVLSDRQRAHPIVPRHGRTIPSSQSGDLGSDIIYTETSPQLANNPIKTTPLTHAQPRSRSIDSKGGQDVFSLSACSACGKKKKKLCQFDGVTHSGNTTYPIIVGIPVSNCGNADDPPISTTVGGEYTVADSWSVDAGIGFNFGELSVDASGNWTHTTSKTFSQSITLTIKPGYQGALIARVMYNQTKGKVTLPTGGPLSVTSNQPLIPVNYEQMIIACDSNFRANISTGLQCSSAGLTVVAPSHLLLVCAVAIVIALILD